MKESFIDIFKEYQGKKAELKALEKDISILQDKLKASIPENDEKGGVMHKVTYSKSVSYAKALPDLKTLIPKTKYKDVDKILASYTSTYPRHTFKEA